MSYTVKIIDGKPWVVDIKGEPQAEIYMDTDEFGRKWFNQERYESNYEQWLASTTKYPTLETHLSHWQALEGKEFDEGSFGVMEMIDWDSNCQKANFAILIPIPQPNEDEVWKDAIVTYKRTYDKYMRSVTHYHLWLKAYYSISKK